MIVLLGVVCISLAGRPNCSPIGPWGTFPTAKECEDKHHEYDVLIRPIEQIDGKFWCAKEDEVT